MYIEDSVNVYQGSSPCGHIYYGEMAERIKAAHC